MGTTGANAMRKTIRIVTPIVTEGFRKADELKALEGTCRNIEEFPPGHYLSSEDGELKKWYTRDWVSFDAVKDQGADIEALRKGLEDAVFFL